MLAVQQALIAHCELLADRFAVLDSESWRRSVRRRTASSSSGAGWTRRAATRRSTPRGCACCPANDGPPILVPPCGHVCGIFARSDTLRGVHKAPANEIVNGALGVERRISLIDQGQLNLHGINIVRVFQDGGRPILWGARTTAHRHQLAVRQHPPPVPLPRGIDPGGHPLGGVRAEQPGALAEAQAHDHRFPARARGATARCSAPRPRKRSTCASTRR